MYWGKGNEMVSMCFRLRKRWRNRVKILLSIALVCLISSFVLYLLQSRDQPLKDGAIRGSGHKTFHGKPIGFRGGKAGQAIIGGASVFLQSRLHQSRDRSRDRSKASGKVVKIGTNVKVPGLEVYVLSAINTPRTPPQTERAFPSEDPSDVIADVYLTSWIDVRTKGKDVDFLCCFTSTPYLQNVTSVEAVLEHYWPNPINMTLAEFSCPLEIQLFKFVAFARDNCTDNVSPLMILEQPRQVYDVTPKHRSSDEYSEDGGDKVSAQALPHLAVCLPGTYGKIPSQYLVEWLELQRILEVSLVYVHYTDLSDETLTVLRYYQQQGLVSMRPFHIPARTGDPARNLFRPNAWDYQAWADAWVTLSDCRRRLAKFNIVMLIDYDEFLLPEPPLTSLRQVFQKAFAKHPQAGYFTSESYIHITDWGVTYPNSSLYFLQRLDCTANNLFDSKGEGRSSPKTFFVPTRVQKSDKHIHLSAYKNYELSQTLAKLHHYRSCKKIWGNKCLTWTRMKEKRFLDFQSLWEAEVKRAMTSLKTLLVQT